MLDGEIILDYRNEGTFCGSASRYSYTPHLRQRVDELLYAAKRSENRFFVLENDIVRAAQSTRDGALRYMQPGFVLVSVHGCGRRIHVVGTNGGTMPCGANLTSFGHTEPYYCYYCAKSSGILDLGASDKPEHKATVLP